VRGQMQLVAVNPGERAIAHRSRTMRRSCRAIECNGTARDRPGHPRVGAHRPSSVMDFTVFICRRHYDVYN
jgi:hypothetical protein